MAGEDEVVLMTVKGKKMARGVMVVAVAVLVLLLAAAAVVPRHAGAAGGVATGQIKWPKWLGCFPDCVMGETCFFHVYRFCMKAEPNAGLVACTVTALDSCDDLHVDDDSGLHPTRPRGRKALSSDSE